MSRNDHLEALHEIRSMMERSSRFISLSGWSGVGAGVVALAGAAVAFWYLGRLPFEEAPLIGYESLESPGRWGISYGRFFFLNALIVLIAALGTAIFFTTRKARRKGHKVWDGTTSRLPIHLFIPLIAVGIFILGLLYHDLPGLAAPAMLVFYGLGLFNASKFTLEELRNLGLLETGLGLAALFNPVYGLECWTLGFGLLHIIYGTYMNWKYERPE